MSQFSDYNLSNQTAEDLRVELNRALLDILSSNSGPAAPTGAHVDVGMLWFHEPVDMDSEEFVEGVPPFRMGICTAVSGTGTARRGTWTRVIAPASGEPPAPPECIIDVAVGPTEIPSGFTVEGSENGRSYDSLGANLDEPCRIYYRTFQNDWVYNVSIPSGTTLPPLPDRVYPRDRWFDLTEMDGTNTPGRYQVTGNGINWLRSGPIDSRTTQPSLFATSLT